MQHPSAAHAIRALAHHPDLLALRFLRYRPTPPGASRARGLQGRARLEALVTTRWDPSLRSIMARRIRAFDSLDALICPADEDEAIALCSHIRAVRGLSDCHIQMIDFSAPPSPENDATLIECMDMLGWHGWLIKSGTSYHFLGCDVLDEREWRDRMATSLLLPVQVDTRWVGHQLRRGYAGLRIWACEAKPTEPYVFASIGLPRTIQTAMWP